MTVFENGKLGIGALSVYCAEHLILKYFWRTIFVASYCFAEIVQDCDIKHFIIYLFLNRKYF